MFTIASVLEKVLTAASKQSEAKRIDQKKSFVFLGRKPRKDILWFNPSTDMLTNGNNLGIQRSSIKLYQRDTAMERMSLRLLYLWIYRPLLRGVLNRWVLDVLYCVHLSGLRLV